MSFGGPIDSMFRSQKANLNLLPKRERLQEIQSRYKPKTQDPIQFKESNIIESLRFKRRLNNQRRQERFRFMLIVGLTLITLMIILYWVVTTDYSEIIQVID
jgi:hypothetical protein